METRHHDGWGHGLRPGTTADLGCLACAREDAAKAEAPAIPDSWQPHNTTAAAIASGWAVQARQLAAEAHQLLAAETITDRDRRTALRHLARADQLTACAAQLNHYIG